MKTIVQLPGISEPVSFASGQVECQDADALEHVNDVLRDTNGGEFSGAVPDLDYYKASFVVDRIGGKIAYYDGPRNAKKRLVN